MTQLWEHSSWEHDEQDGHELKRLDAELRRKEIYDALRAKHGPIWINRQGEFEPIALMTERRLQSCVDFVERKLAALVSPWSLPEPHGDVANDEYWQHISDADDEYYRRRSTLIQWKVSLAKEVERRNKHAKN